MDAFPNSNKNIIIGKNKLEAPDQEKADKQSRMASIDVVSSLIVMTVAAAVSIWAVNMTRPSGWPSAPGLVPLLFASTMFLMGLGLFISAIRKKGLTSLGSRLSSFSGQAFFQDKQTRRSIWIISLIFIYMVIFTGHLPFEIAGFLFLIGTFTVFWKKGRWLKLIIASIVPPLVFSLVFRFLFSILLPGDSIFDYFL